MAEEKKIIIDEDWKSQVAAEKEKAAHEPPEKPAEDAGSTEYPPASLGVLITSLATEAMIAMGQIPHPMTGEPAPDRQQARFTIDLLEVLQEKTKGNLDADEEAGLRDLLHQLRMAFVTLQ
ncbi:MAG: DUF1844 domain-containing protein [Planctomycetales bacterium]|nr:DUF1844 domain-containing protein [Planctomycetales bacterium]